MTVRTAGGGIQRRWGVRAVRWVGPCLALLVSPATVVAQGGDARTSVSPTAPHSSVRIEDAVIGSDAERYLRALETLSGRRASGVPVVLVGPWSIDSVPRLLSLRGVSADLSWNAGLPYGRDDGPAWQGRGGNARFSALALWQWRGLSLRVAPMLWWARNTAFAMLPTGPTPFSHPQVGCCIDLPQRFGDASVARLDPGESSLAFDWRGARVAVTSAASRIGAGREHVTLLQGDAGGYPRVEAGVPGGVPTPLGRFSGNVAWGRLAQTPWAPDRRAGARLGTHLEAWWTAPGRGLLEVGGGRFYHFDWNGLSVRDLGRPFGSIFYDAQVYAGGEADNQQLSVFARVRMPESGFEFAGELAKNDRSNDLRDFGNELEHNSAWLVVARRAWRSGSALWVVNATTSSVRIPELQLYRGQALNYEHSPITQGHTLRGQLLGTPLLERGAGAELRVDRYDAGGRVTMIASSRNLPDVRAEAVPDAALRQEWALHAEWMRWTPSGAVTLRLGSLVEVATSAPSGNRLAWHFSTGYRWLR